MDPYQNQAHLLKFMAHPRRLQILDRLRATDECVCHLAAVLAKPQPYVSQQIAVLRKAGLICDRKDGTHIYYELAENRMVTRSARCWTPSSRRRQTRHAGTNTSRAVAVHNARRPSESSGP